MAMPPDYYQSLLPQKKSLEEEMMDQYRQSLTQREGSIKEARERAAALEAQGTGLDSLNLAPMMAFVDAQTGSNMAASYKGPTRSKETEIERLRQAVGQQEAGLVDDRLNVSRLMMEDRRAAERNQLTADQNEANRDLKMLLLDKRLGAQADAAEAKDAKKAAEKANKDSQNILKTKESQKVQAQISFKEALDEYASLVDQYGIQLTGANKDQLESAYNKLNLKHKEGENLGALTGPDMGIMVSSIAPVTGLSGAGRLAAARMGFGGGVEGVKKGIATIRNQADKDFAIAQGALETTFGPESPTLQSYRSKFYGGMKKKASSPGAGGAPPPEAKEVQIIFNGQQMTIPAADLESALKDGATLVKGNGQ